MIHTAEESDTKRDKERISNRVRSVQIVQGQIEIGRIYRHGRRPLPPPAAPGGPSGSIPNRRSRSSNEFCEGRNMLILESDLPL